MKKSEWYSSLSVRSVVHLTVVGLLLAALISGNAIIHQRRIVLAEMEQRGALLGESLANACSLPYFLGDKQTVSYVISKAANLQDVLSLKLLDRKNAVELEMPPESGKLDGSVLGRLDDEKPTVWDDHESIHVLVPLKIERQASAMEQMLSPQPAASGGRVHSDVLGHLYVRLSLVRANRLVRDFIRKSVLFTAGAIVLGSSVVFFLLRKNVLTPIRRLVRAMAAIRHGNLEMLKEDGKSADEIGVLISAFNEMAIALRQSEDDLKKANAELEERVMVRTMDLAKANQELKETQEKVVRSEKLAAIGQLASGVSHELRNPLFAINNAIYYLTTALKGTPVAEKDPLIPEFLGLATREINSATRIIHDLLDYSRIPKLSPQDTDINALLLEAKTMVEMPSSVRVVEQLEKDLQHATVDRDKIRQVFMNLIQNAVQAMPTGGELRLSTGMGNGTGKPPLFKIEVRDTGSGIKEEELKKVFEPLFTTKAKGTGLGLPISLGIVQKHGGEIQVASTVGKGTVFTVLLPAGGVPS